MVEGHKKLPEQLFCSHCEKLFSIEDYHKETKKHWSMMTDIPDSWDKMVEDKGGTRATFSCPKCGWSATLNIILQNTEVPKPVLKKIIKKRMKPEQFKEALENI